MLKPFRPICLSLLASLLFLPSAPSQVSKPVVPASRPAKQPDKKVKVPNAQAPASVPKKDAEPSPKETPPKKEEPKTPTAAAKSDVIRVTIEPSRPTVTTEDTSFAFYGDLENVGSSMVTLYSRETVLVVAPEISRDHGGCILAIFAFFPTEPSPEPGKSQRILLRPQEHYVVAWSVAEDNTRDCSSGPEAILDEEAQERKLDQQKGTTPGAPEKKAGSRSARGFWSSLWDEIAFAPGKYRFTVEGDAYTYDETKKAQNEGPPHRFVESTSLNVGISQMTAMVAAAFGGLFGYLVMLLRPNSTELKMAKDTSAFSFYGFSSGVARRVVSAMMLSGIIAIVTSRVSDAPIPIKVSIPDVWGAFTLGFIAYFVGDRFIKWLAEKVSGTGQNPPAGQTAQQTPPASQTGGQPAAPAVRPQ